MDVTLGWKIKLWWWLFFSPSNFEKNKTQTRENNLLLDVTAVGLFLFCCHQNKLAVRRRLSRELLLLLRESILPVG
jgi:hypothetical protein